MVSGEAIAYNVASFACALFLLEFGADKFIDHTAVVAKRTGVPQTIVALLTAGAEWEELAVVVISIARHRSSLAIGNIIGSVISNILGAFSLGLLFYKTTDGPVVFDKSSKLYTLVLLGITGLIAGLVGFGHDVLWRVVGGVIIGLFAVYLASIFWAIRKGLATAPELSDSDDDESGIDDFPHSHSTEERAQQVSYNTNGAALSTGISTVTGPLPGLERSNGLFTTPQRVGNPQAEVEATETETPGQPTQEGAHSLVGTTNSDPTSNNTKHSLIYHVVYLFIGFLALVLSAYVLSNAASNLVDQFGISDVLFGVVILSIATTIPEKFVAIVSGSRGHMGIMVANTVGSNIFLLTLCMGILWTSTKDDLSQGSVNATELGIMLGSSALVTATVWLGAKWVRYIGAAMLAAYVAFIILEFTVIRHV